VEVLQNCVIFNNRIHSEITGKDVRDDHQIHLVHGKPMLFGKEMNKGLTMRGSRLEVVTIGENGVKEEDILVHDAHNPDDTTHYMLVRMTLPEYPVATGVIRSCECVSTYDAELEFQLDRARNQRKMDSLQDLLEDKSFMVD
jgi:2-oxoglutarate ferredoxin oxidoreductase subunit beta